MENYISFYLRLKEYPDEWTPERIAESFPISVEGARKVRSKTWRPRYIEEVINYDKRVQRRWLELKAAGEKEGGPITNRYSRYHIVITGNHVDG